VALKLRQRINNIVRVLTVDAKKGWWALLPLMLMALAPGLVTCDPEKHLRYAGLLLQLLGLVVVAIGIRDTRRLFGRPTLTAAIRVWIGKLAAAFGPPLIRVSASATIAIESRAAGQGTVSTALTERSSTVEQRLAELERANVEIRQGLREISRQVTAIGPELREMIDKERDRRVQEDLKLRRLLEDQAAGGLHLETAALIWLLIGTIVATISSELSRFAAHLPCVG
jgi:hypothetical protein